MKKINYNFKEAAKELLVVTTRLITSYDDYPIEEDFWHIHILLNRLSIFSNYWGINSCLKLIEFYSDKFDNLSMDFRREIIENVKIVAQNTLKFIENKES